VPNISLNNLWIENVTRSKAMKEVIEVNVSFDTSFEDIELLRQEMEKFVRAPENCRDFQPDIAIGVGGVGNCDKLTLTIAIKHKSNWHNEAVRATRRSKFMCALALALKRVPINGPGGGGDPLGGPSNPTYSVAVTDEFAANARAKSEESKAAKKLANQNPDEAAGTVANTSAEQRAAEQINTTSPVAEALDDWGYENTLAGRDPSADRSRTGAAGASPRTDALSARESQRGRRKAGETLPPNVLLGENADMPALQLTRSSTSTRQNTQRSFDVERQAGMPAPPGASPFTTWTAYDPQGLAPGAVDAAGIPLQPGSFGSPSMGAGPTYPNVQQPGAPVQRAASGRSPVGARPRGSSVSRPPQGDPPAQGGAASGSGAAGSSARF
jgi:hypothetical protein